MCRINISFRGCKFDLNSIVSRNVQEMIEKGLKAIREVIGTNSIKPVEVIEGAYRSNYNTNK